MTPLGSLADVLADSPAVDALIGGRVDAVAVPEAARALAVAALRSRAERPVLVVTPTVIDAERLSNDLSQLLGSDAAELYPAWETLPFERVSPSVETMGRRLRVMWRLRTGGRSTPGVVVAPVRALVQRLGPHVEDIEPVIVRTGAELDRDELLETLVSTGYRREYQVEARGEVAVRGSIVDIYPSTSDYPIRLDLWGDEVDRLQAFSVADQRATHDVDGMAVFGARELLPTPEVRERARSLVEYEPWGEKQWKRIADGEVFDGMESWLPWLTADEHLLTDLFPETGVVLLTEPTRTRDRALELLDDEAALADSLSGTWGASGGHDFPRLSLPFDRLLAHTGARVVALPAAPDSPSTPHLPATSFDPVDGSADTLAQRVRSLCADGNRVVLAADGAASAERLSTLLGEDGVDAPVLAAAGDIGPGNAGVVTAPLEHGAVIPEVGLAVVAESDLGGRRRPRRRSRRGAGRSTDGYEGLEPGDFVVHVQHGVGRYAGMTTRDIGGVERDYMLLEYRGADRLYVPTDQVGVVRPYTGGDSPTLQRLGGSDWEKTRARARAAVQDIAEELVALYRRRAAAVGHAFSADTPWQHEMEEAFGFQVTPDQHQAIEDIKADMESTTPMDRLVCGDVGYGKTEVAVRAAFKAVQDGKQVALLAPTTLLATQHGQTFRDRYANYPVRVEVLSRFLTDKEAREVLVGVESGDVDLVIGTHRLLSADVHFKDLGLLIVDEEQRFGVQHKERIKALRADVDALTLTATPIPRTLELSLTGIRDLSLINTPPEDRQPILTYVGEQDDAAVSEAIRRELLREGQVFYVHNRVQSIDHAAEVVRHLVPEARVGVAHGQMPEASLEQIVMDFWDQRFDVLVCTTIVESGLDIPGVNTMVVDRADRLGLAQLYQLRGRIGRRGRRAYAYLLHPPDRRLSEEAYERLKTIGEFTDLGSGFKIARRDLEIRGAGNMLGAEQSGHVAAVGFDLYCEMVTEAVAELTGRVKESPPEVSLDLPVDAYLPSDYIERDDLRVEAYRRLGRVSTTDELADVTSEWTDRYGAPPEAVSALLEVAALRVACADLGITEVAVNRGTVRVRGLELTETVKAKVRARLRDGVVKGPEELAARLPEGESVPAAVLGLLGRLVPVAGSPVPSPA